MTIEDLLHQDSEWMKGTGPQSEVVMSSRTRLARNFEGFAYSHWADDAELEKVLVMVKEAAESCNFLKGALFIRLADASELDRLFLVERHLMSPEHTRDVKYKALIIDPKEIVSIMVNEEDHLRIQVLQSGLNLTEAWRIIDDIDTALSKKLPFCYSTKLGYLTACPTNIGTGLRGSVMVHLPALVFAGQIEKVLQATTKLGLNIRGFYGEGTEASGNLFQVSNQVSLGRTEDDIVENIDRIIGQIITREETARKNIMLRNKEALADRVSRAYGTLKSAHIITSKETAALLSAIRLGVDLGLVTNLDRKKVNELFISTQPAHLQKLSGRVLTSEERDVKRAELIREKLK